MMVALDYGEVREWLAEPVLKAARDVKKDADALEESRDEVESAVPSSWLGRPRGSAAYTRDRLVKLMNTHLEDRRQVQKALEQAADLVTEVESLVRTVEAQAELYGGKIDYDGNLTFLGTPPPEETKKEIRWTVRRILGQAAAAEATIIKSIPRDQFWNLEECGTFSPEVAKYWAERTDDERKAIIKQAIEELAKENGIDPDTIKLDLRRLNDPSVLDAAAYEARRTRQNEMAFDMNNLNDPTWPWEDNPFDRYEDDGILEQAEKWTEDFADFWVGPDEEDARYAAREYVEGMTKAKLERLLEESRR